MAVVIAQFLDDDAASAAVTFLKHQGIKADVLDMRGPRGGGALQLLVRVRDATRALKLLRRVERGEFAEGWPGRTEEVSLSAMAFSRALFGSIHSRYPTWTYSLPVWAVGALVLIWLAACLATAFLS